MIYKNIRSVSALLKLCSTESRFYVYNNVMKNDKETKKEIDDQTELSQTRILEKMTDSSYDHENKEKTSDTEKKDETFDDENIFFETSVLEKLTDDQKDQTETQVKKPVEHKEEKGDSAEKEVLSFIRDLVICVVAVFLLTSFVVRPVQVKGNSMYPELNNASIGFSNVLGYSMNGLKRFDVAIIYVAEKDEYLVKRVIGLPGETVSYMNGRLYIDGNYVEESFLNQDYVDSYNGTFMTDVAPITLGEDEYYCLGDNRPHSSDSRYYGPFKKENIKSKGVFIFWPFDKFSVQTW